MNKDLPWLTNHALQAEEYRVSGMMYWKTLTLSRVLEVERRYMAVLAELQRRGL